MNEDNVRFLIKPEKLTDIPLRPFDDNVVLFLNELAKQIRKDKRCRDIQICFPLLFGVEEEILRNGKKNTKKKNGWEKEFYFI